MADGRRRYDERQRRRRAEEADDDRTAGTLSAPVDGHGYEVHDEERDEEHADEQEAGRLIAQRIEVDRHATPDEEHGGEEAVADGIELGAELGVFAQRAPIEHAEQRAGHERAEDGLQA